MFPVLSGVTFLNAYPILKFIANDFGSLEEGFVQQDSTPLFENLQTILFTIETRKKQRFAFYFPSSSDNLVLVLLMLENH